MFDIIKPLANHKSNHIAEVINNIRNKTLYDNKIMERMKLTP
jgi:hypothetical protein